MANGDSAATALIARLTLLMLNLVLLGLGIALCVLGSNEDGTAGLIRAIYAEGGLTMAAFQKPDVALAVSGAFIICTSLQVRAHARPRILTRSSLPRSPPSHPAGFGGAESRAQFQLGANNRSPPCPELPGLPRILHRLEAHPLHVPHHVSLSPRRCHILRGDDARVQG